MRKQYKYAKLFSSTHTVKVVFNIGHWSVLDNLVHMWQYFYNYIATKCYESIIFTYGLEGLPFSLSFTYENILMWWVLNAYLSIGIVLYSISNVS